jgi:hypothetical protein
MKQGSLRRLAELALLSVSGLCASCVPLTLHYYLPSAEGADVRSMSCSEDPPYAANLHGRTYPQLLVLVSLAQRPLTGNHDPSLTVIIVPADNEHIVVDPTLIHIAADGQPVQPNSIRYYLGKSGAAPAHDAQGPIDAKTDSLNIDLPLKINGASKVVTHLPSITVNGEVYDFPDVSFKLERRTRLTMIAGNC